MMNTDEPAGSRQPGGDVDATLMQSRAKARLAEAPFHLDYLNGRLAEIERQLTILGQARVGLDHLAAPDASEEDNQSLLISRTALKRAQQEIEEVAAELKRQIGMLKEAGLRQLEQSLTDLRETLDSPIAVTATRSEIAPNGVLATSLSVALATLDDRERTRMNAIRSALQLSNDEEVIESCVAVQNYFTTKVGEGWRILLERGRDRREVLLPTISRGRNRNDN